MILRTKKVVRQSAILLLLLVILLLTTSCFRISMVPYYKDKANYQTYEGTLTEIFYHEVGKQTLLYLVIEDQQPSLSDRTFSLERENMTLAVENGIDELEPGTKVSFVTAPKYYGDGYVMPLVGLSANGITYLDAEIGIDNWIKMLDENWIDYLA